ELSGTGTIEASGGTLDLQGTVDSGLTLAINGTLPVVSTLKISGTATSAAAITLNAVNQMLEIGAAGALTIGAAHSVTNASIQLDGGTLTDSAGISIGATGTLSGSGTVNADLSGTGTVAAAGGTLDLTGTVSSGVQLAIIPIVASTLKISGTATSSAALTF